MARPKITGGKVEETTTVESKKKGKGKTTRKRHPLPPRREGDAYTISEFCAANRISASMYHKLKSLGLGPVKWTWGGARSSRRKQTRSGKPRASARPRPHLPPEILE
jgi:hypothetical protein